METDVQYLSFDKNRLQIRRESLAMRRACQAVGWGRGGGGGGGNAGSGGGGGGSGGYRTKGVKERRGKRIGWGEEDGWRMWWIEKERKRKDREWSG